MGGRIFEPELDVVASEVQVLVPGDCELCDQEAAHVSPVHVAHLRDDSFMCTVVVYGAASGSGRGVILCVRCARALMTTAGQSLPGHHCPDPDPGE